MLKRDHHSGATTVHQVGTSSLPTSWHQDGTHAPSRTLPTARCGLLSTVTSEEVRGCPGPAPQLYTTRRRLGLTGRGWGRDSETSPPRPGQPLREGGGHHHRWEWMGLETG